MRQPVKKSDQFYLLMKTTLFSTHTLMGWLVFGISLTVYTLTIEPTASFWDSGEFIASAYKLQIPHPPGPPLFLLIGRFFSLFALEDPAKIGYMVNMLSAVSSAATVMFMYWVIVMLGGKFDAVKNETLLTIAGGIGALAFAFSDTFWFSASETEVYALSTFFISIVLWAILKLDQSGEPVAGSQWTLLIACLMGLSIGVHPMSLLAIPTMVYLFYFKKHQLTLKGITIATSMALGLTLFMMYGFRLGLVELMKKMELLFVNTLGLPFNSGVLFFAIALISLLTFGIIHSIKKRKALLNTVLLSASFVIIGYSSYMVIVIRSGFDPPIDQNNPENIANMIGYLDMAQYGTRPLVYGENFTSRVRGYENDQPVYRKTRDKYEITDYTTKYQYDSSDLGLFPRMYSQAPHHVAGYRKWTGLKNGQSPDGLDNIKFFLAYQTGHMYLRYFLWNFAGRQGDVQDAGWLAFWENTDPLPESLKQNPARNNYYFLPLLLGLIGLWYHFKRDRQSFLGVLALFVITGVGLVVYLNSPAPEPRERDYIYVGSFYAFSIWIGLGVLALHKFWQKVVAQRYALVAAAGLAAAVPLVLLHQGWDDHNRSNRYFTTDLARNHLASCAESAILFTGGDNDTFPLWYVQEAEGFRTDIRAIVLSYFNAEWYIEQSTRQANASSPLPFSLQNESYKRGGFNDYILHVEHPNLKGKPIDLKQYLKLIKTSHKALQIETSTGQKINSLPSKLLSLSTDTDVVKEKKIVPDTIVPFISPKVNIPVTKNGLEKKDLMILDLIASNNWERPIYFTYTALHSLNFDISHMVVQEGYTYRLLPVNNPNPEELLVDTETMYKNLMHRFEWRGTGDRNVYYSTFHKNQMTHVRANYNQLASALIKEGKLERARKALYQNLHVIPDDTIPYDVASINTARLLGYIGEKEKGLEISKTMTKRVNDELDYYIERRRGDSENITKNLALLNMLSQNLDEAGALKEADRARQLLRRYYDKFNQI